MAVSFIGGGNPEKTTDLPQVTDPLYRILVYLYSQTDSAYHIYREIIDCIDT